MAKVWSVCHWIKVLACVLLLFIVFPSSYGQESLGVIGSSCDAKAIRQMPIQYIYEGEDIFRGIGSTLSSLDPNSRCCYAFPKLDNLFSYFRQFPSDSSQLLALNADDVAGFAGDQGAARQSFIPGPWK